MAVENIKVLRGYEQHGVTFTDDNDKDAVGNCPFCGRSGKLWVNKSNKLYRCFHCEVRGNYATFLNDIQLKYIKEFRGSMVHELCADRGLRPPTLRAWGVGWAGNFYTIPESGNPNNTITNVRRYWIGRRSIATSGTRLSLIVPANMPDKSTIWLCEGEWDGMALWEMANKIGEELLIWAVPGAGSLPKDSIGMFMDKDVIVCFDYDEPGRLGAVMVGEKLSGVAKSCKYIHWPAKSVVGFDMREHYHGFKHAQDAFTNLNDLIYDAPPIGIGEEDIINEPKVARLKAQIKLGIRKPDEAPTEALLGEGMRCRKVNEVFKKWLSMKTTDPLDVMFGAVFANRIQGDPLWLFFVAPPGGMKTELLMSLSKAPKIITTTTLTPHSLVSGANFAGGDPSLIPRLDGKVLIIKDMTTILEMNQTAREEIFGILRDAYDGKTEKIFGNGITRRYHSRFGIIAGVTPIIEGVSQTNATLGERFLKYRIKQHQSKQSREDSIRQALRNIKDNNQMQVELTEACTSVLNWSPGDNYIPAISDDMLERLVGLSQWVAALRGVVNREKYTGRVQFKPTTEVGTRLAKQLCKLAYGIAIYRRDPEITERVYQIVAEVAQDTAPDRVEEIVHQMFVQNPDDYSGTKEIAFWSRFPDDTVRYLLQDMVMLNIIVKNPQGAGQWKLHPQMTAVMRSLKLYPQWMPARKPAVQ